MSTQTLMPGSVSMHFSKVIELLFQVVLHCALWNHLGLFLDWIYVDQLGCLVTKDFEALDANMK